jgi:4-hydroxy-3-polyprenylbenzoate decarboxylase
MGGERRTRGMEDLREFIKRIKELGELRTIEGAHWDLEIGSATYLAAKASSSPALLFDRVPGYPAGYRILANPYSNDRRLALTLGLPLEASRLELVRKVRERLNEPFKPVPPVVVKDGPVMQNVFTDDQVDLFKFPTPKWLSLDGGRYLGTGDTIIARDPDEGWVNVSTQRLQVHDKCTATIFSEPGKHLAMIREKYWARGQNCPMAVTCGGHPIYICAGGLRIPWGVSEYEWLGWWRKKSVEVIKGPTTGLPIPADAEIVLEGEMVPPGAETRMEGPFSEWTGHYSPARPEPAFKVKSILHRNDPIILAVLPFLGRGAVSQHTGRQVIKAAKVWSALDQVVPGVKGVWVFFELGGSANIVISLEQKYGGHAKQVAMAALGLDSYMTKFVIVVDEDVDPSNLREVLWAIGLRSEPEEWEAIKGTWSGYLDPRIPPSKRELGDMTHSTAIIYACKPYYWIKDFSPAVHEDLELEKRVKEKWGSILL